MKSSIALAALVVAVIGSTAVPAFAQDAAPAQASPVAGKFDNNGPRQMHRMADRDGGMGMTPRFLGLVCSDRGSEMLEIAFVRLSHRLELTADQQKLFDTLRTKALSTQTSFADACKAAMPDRTADQKPDLLAGLKAGIAVETARLAAITEVLPDFEAFYSSLTDEQKASLLPRGGDMGPGPDGNRGMLRMQPPGKHS